jgi:hypothetical protein
VRASPLAVLFLVVPLTRAIPARGADGEEAPYRERSAMHKKVAASFDPLGVLDSRYGAQVEVLPVRDVSVAVSPWIISVRHAGSSDFVPGSDHVSSVIIKASGVDGQFRLYPIASKTGGDGIYVAPGFVLQRFEVISQECSPRGRCGAEVAQKWAYYGPAFDLGYQEIFSAGFLVAASVGVHYRFASEDISTASWTAWSQILHGPGLRPRFRAAFGFAF